MARSQQAVFLQTYLSDAIAEEVVKHGRHNQKAHGRRGRGMPTGKTRTRMDIMQSGRRKSEEQVQVNMTGKERAATAAIGLVAGNVATLFAGPVVGTGVVAYGVFRAVRGKRWVGAKTERASGPTDFRPTTKAAAKMPPIPPAMASRIQTGYRRWLEATGRSDTDDAAREFSQLVEREAARRKKS